MNFTKLVIVALSSLVFAGCNHVQTETKSQELPVVNEVVQPQEELEENAMVEEDDMLNEKESMESRIMQLNASDFTFGVEKIEAKVGEELVVVITNDKGVHDLVIDELDVNTGIIKQGDSMEITIPTDKPGTYEYYCSVGSHRKLGMKGMLIIK